MVAPDGDWAQRLAASGLALDEGSVHPGQGTRNRRVPFAERYLELLWVHDVAEAARNPVRLDRRADWRTTGASPFGFGLRGDLAEKDRGGYWLYEDLGIPIWIHRDNEEAPKRPLLFVVPVPQRARVGQALRAVRVSGWSRPSLPAYDGPPVHHRPGPPDLELDLGLGQPTRITDILSIV